MRTTHFLLQTSKENPADAELISHQLMLRAGLIRKLASGLYTWLPLGLRVMHKVMQIVREEMDQVGAQEILMPTIQPAELWHESARWDQFGPELLRIKDRHDRDFCYGPTHEEIITDIARHTLRSYKQLPTTLYQIQTKFRDEIRPRFGVMRSREFMMKDAYSFHLTDESLQETYKIMYDTYTRIFSRMDLTFRAVLADTGSMGGSTSHEFQVLADAGESEIAYSDESDYAINTEMPAAQHLKAGDPSPDGHGKIKIARGIEVGQVFQLGKKYSDAMHATVLNDAGEPISMTMGCYGIGISRTVAAIIEQYHDDKGIIWPDSVAPFQIALTPIAMHKSETVKTATEKLYHQLIKHGYDVLLDDRDERAGVMFKDMDLIGIPHRLVISDRSLTEGTIEYKARQDAESQQIKIDNIIDFLNGELSSEQG